MHQGPYDNDSLASTLDDALMHGGEEAVMALLNKNADINFNYNLANISYSTAVLHWAVRNNHANVLKLSLADPHVNPKAGNSAVLCWAACTGQTESIKLLLADSRINPRAQFNFAIRVAVENGHLEVVDVLLDHPAVMGFVSENIAQFKDNKPVLDLIFKKFLEKMSPCIAALYANNIPNEVIVNNFGPLIHPLFQHYAKSINDETKTSTLSCDSLFLNETSKKLLPIYESKKMYDLDSKERNPAKKIKEGRKYSESSFRAA